VTIDAWLAELGLGEYAAVFAANAIDFDVLPDLTEADLEKLGVLLGHRKKLLRAIKTREAVAPETPATFNRPETEAERRQITVLFSDLVGSTALSQTIDPETLRDLLAAYQAMAAEAIGSMGGVLAKFLGDGVLAYFGYPTASEDDAIRAVRAACAMISGMTALNALWRKEVGREIELRVGLHTGVVVVGELGTGAARESHAIVGETPNLAARVQGLAAPGTVAISRATWRLVRRVFSCRSLGIQQAKGVADGIEVYAVGAEIATNDALEAASDIPLVGRTEEATLLRERLRAARAGTGCAVLVSGEAGVGKSRLMRAFRQSSADMGELIALRCAPQHRNSAFYPVIGWLERGLGFAANDARDGRRAKLEAKLTALDLACPEIARPIGELLGVSEERPLVAEDQRRRQLLGALLQVVVAEATAGTGAAALIAEDVHWADASTLEFLGLLLARLPEHPLLALLTFRPDFLPPWPIASHITTLALDRMGREELAEIARRRAGKDLPHKVLQELLSKADGIPLFAEELTQTVLASGAVIDRDGHLELAPNSSAIALPGTLRDSLTARLDRLSGARRLAQIAAVIGREFEYRLLANVADLDNAALDRDLEILTRSDILHQRGMPPEAKYTFKHALIQEAAYDGLLRPTRQQYHARIAAAYEESGAASADAFPEILAQHYAAAGERSRAIGFYERAAEQARRRSGLRESIAHLRAALELLARLPESLDRDRQELTILLSLGPLIATIDGIHTPGYLRIYTRAEDLAERTRQERQHFAATWGLWFYEQVGAEPTKAIERADKLFAISDRIGDPDLRLEAYHSRWAVRLFLGDLDGARADAAEGLARYDKHRHAVHRFTYGGHDTGCCAHALGGVAAVLAGESGHSASLLHAGVTLAREIGDPPVLAHALAFAAIGAQIRGDLAVCRAIGDEVIEINKTHTVKQFNVIGIVTGGWAYYASGDAASGRELIGVGRRLIEGTKLTSMLSPFVQVLLADIEARTGDAPGALARLLASLAKDGNSCCFDAELIRRIGELRLLISPDKREEAAQDFRRAIDIARRQGARTLELRAALALARLLVAQRRHEEAQALLRPITIAITDDAALPGAILREAGRNRCPVSVRRPWQTDRARAFLGCDGYGGASSS